MPDGWDWKRHPHGPPSALLPNVGRIPMTSVSRMIPVWDLSWVAMGRPSSWRDSTAPPTSWRAVAYAAGLARRQRSRLLVIHIAAVPALVTLAPVADVAIEGSLDAAAEELRDELESRREWHELNAEFRVERGDVYTGLCRVAETEKVDAVVVGASAQAGHRLVGSLAVRLVKPVDGR